MFHIRTFRNTDPKIIMEIWGQVHAEGSLALTPLNTSYLCADVLGLPYFDPRGLFLAWDDGRPVGLAHAAFGPNKDGTDINHETGVICLILVVPGYRHEAELKLEFIERCENYLRQKGSKVIFGGSTRSSASFYSGLYGGSEPLGIYENDRELLNAYETRGFCVQYRTIRFRQNLEMFRPPFTPKSAVWNKKLQMEIRETLPRGNWVKDCAQTYFNWYEAVGNVPGEREPIVEVLIRTSSPFDGTSTGSPASHVAALVNVTVREAYRGKGVATFAVGKLIRHLIDVHKIKVLETLALEHDLSYVKLANTLGLRECNHGVVLIKILQERRIQVRTGEELETSESFV